MKHQPNKLLRHVLCHTETKTTYKKGLISIFFIFIFCNKFKMVGAVTEKTFQEICDLIFRTNATNEPGFWVLYEHGTAVHFGPQTFETRDQLVAAANELIGVEVCVGTPTADFNPLQLNFTTDGKQVYFVAYSEPSTMGTLMTSGATADDFFIGIQGREKRRLDCEEKKICTTSFDFAAAQ
ncbi:hypothetical protein BC940DRAFT_297564 [Gongronella butleri]|nr:hypothetical protein BC940DRAFT_297564 [Gongronella butleri]